MFYTRTMNELMKQINDAERQKWSTSSWISHRSTIPFKGNVYVKSSAYATEQEETNKKVVAGILKYISKNVDRIKLYDASSRDRRYVYEDENIKVDCGHHVSNQSPETIIELKTINEKVIIEDPTIRYFLYSNLEVWYNENARKKEKAKHDKILEEINSLLKKQ